MVASDLARTLSFYCALGLDIRLDADNEPHVEVTLPSGFRIMFDPESTIASFATLRDPDGNGVDLIASLPTSRLAATFARVRSPPSRSQA